MSNVISLKKVGCVRCGTPQTVRKFCLECEMKNGTKYPEPEFRWGENAQQFSYSEELFAIGWDLIRARHRYLIDLDIRVDFIFLKNTPVQKGREIWGRLKKISGLNAWLADEERRTKALPDAFFVIEISYLVWKKLTAPQRVALIEHELCHATTKEGKASTKGHDHEEFVGILKIHGLWTESAKAMIEAGNNPLYKEEIVNEATDEDFDDFENDFDDQEAA